MKKIITLLAVWAFALGFTAQSADTSHLGIRLSIDAAMPGDLSVGNGYTSISMFGAGAGMSIGAVYRIDLTENFFIEPGVSLYYNAPSINKHFLEDELDTSIDISIKSRSLRKSGLRIPIMAGYTFPMGDDFSFRVFTGPMLDFGMSADMYYSLKVEGYDVHKAFSAYGDGRLLRRFDCYWNFGAGVTFAQRYYLGLQLDLGMCNIARKQDQLHPGMHENLVQLTFGYNL